jgi:hypothetical protein
MGAKAFHVDQALTNFAVGYHPGNMIAEKIAPPIKVNKESDKYYVWDRADAFRTQRSDGNFSLRADKAESKEIDFGLGTSTYSAEEYALHILISEREKNNADSILRLRESKVKRLQDIMMLEQEIRVATLLTTGANWDSNHTSAPSVKWDAASGVVIEKNIDEAKEVVRKAIGFEPNTIVIPAAVAKSVKRDATIRELIKYTQNNLLVNGDLPPTLFNMNVMIPGASYTSSIEGATATYADVWGDNVLLLYVAPDSIDAPVPVKIFRARDWRVFTWMEEKRGNSEAIEASVIQDEVITSNVSGYLLTDVLT